MLAPAGSHLPRAFWGLWIGALVAWTGRMVIPFLTIYFTQQAGYSALAAGLLVSLNGLGGLVASFVGGSLIDRIGARAVVLVSLGVAAVLCGVMAAFMAPAVVGTLLFLLGVSTQAQLPAINALAATIVPANRRRAAFSLIYVAINAGFSVGPIAGGLLVEQSFRFIFLGAAVTTAVALAVCARTIPRGFGAGPTPAPVRLRPGSGPLTRGLRRGRLRATRSPRRRLASYGQEGFGPVFRDRNFRTFALLNVVFLMVYLQSQSTLPIVLAQQGYSTPQYGALLFINGFGLVLFQLPADRLMRKVPADRLLVAASGVLAVGFLLNLWAVNWWWYAAAMFVWTVAELLSIPVSIAITSDIAPRELTGRYLGVFTAGFPIGALGGPIIGGWLLDVSGSTSLWIVCTAIALLTVFGRASNSAGLRARL